MNTFLNKTASHLISKYNENLEHLLIVLPNKRAGLFLKQELSKLIKNPIWIPEIIGTEDFYYQIFQIQFIKKMNIEKEFLTLYILPIFGGTIKTHLM